MKKREQANQAKAAWMAARKASKPKDEVEALRKTYQTLNDEADIEEADAEAGAGEKKQDGAKEVTLVEIQGFVSEGVKQALGDQAKHVTAEQVETIVTAAFKKFAPAPAGEAPKLTAANVKSIMEESVTKLMEAGRKAGKMQHEEGEGHGSIEIPLGLTKGNLPVWKKQLLNCLMKKHQDDGIDAKDLAKARAIGDRILNQAREGKGVSALDAKAMTSTGAGTGDEWVPTDLSAELQRRLYLDSLIAQAMMNREIQMPTNPYTMPLNTTRPVMYQVATENTSPTASDPATTQPSLTAVKIAGKVLYSYELDEDSIVPILNTLTTLLAEAAAYSLESMIINGDTTATHMDSDTQAIAGAPEKAWKGLRRLAYDVAGLKVDLTTGGLSRANLISVLKKLKKYGKRPGDLAMIVGSMGHSDILGLDDTLTLEKVGSRATILSGTISSIFGIPILISEANREDLNASGVYDGTTTTRGSILIANLTRFMLGNRRDFLIETDRDIETQQNKIVISFRKAFTPLEVPSATVTSVAMGYNYLA